MKWWLGLALLAACTKPSAQGDDAFQGTVEYDTVTLAFEVAGKLAWVGADEGDQLSEGHKVVARLDDSLLVPERAARAAELDAQRAQLALLEAGARKEDVRSAAAELESVRQQEEVLARQRKRQEELSANGAAPKSLLDSLEAQRSQLNGQRGVAEERLRALRGGARAEELMVARAQVRALEAALALADARLTKHELSYDQLADVLDVHVDPGEVVAPGTPIMTVADLAHPYVDVFVPQQRIASVHVGQRAEVRVDGVANPVAGLVERIGTRTEFTPRYLYSEKERATLVLRVRVRVADRERVLHAGVPGFVKIESDNTEKPRG
ncbi:MAG TPA: HlyD family efflux transporter periplasmic adaptor subunit [Polyangiales bacterium]|nr:HlyD family efflux transporter periplasmic adaptor subunit [Polyangiales bacterium]